MALTVTPAGLPVTTWSTAVEHAPRRQLRDLAPQATRLVVVSAHPDDETIGVGRLVAQWARERGPVLALTLTAGEACFDAVGIEEPRLAERRIAEWRAALRVLGVTAGPHSVCPDGAVTEHESRVAGVIAAQLRPGDLVVAPWRHDPHPDHEAAGRAAAVAAAESGAALVEYPVWMPYWMTPESVASAGAHWSVVDTDRVAEGQRDGALAAYVSQQEPVRPGTGPVVPPLLLEHHHAQLVVA
jgi:LmbE family N-acetylglucosaminyl deacetylase